MEEAPKRVMKRIVAKLPPPPTNFIVPNIKIVHNRATVEVMRGKKTAAERTEELLQQKLAEAAKSRETVEAAHREQAKALQARVGAFEKSAGGSAAAMWGRSARRRSGKYRLEQTRWRSAGRRNRRPRPADRRWAPAGGGGLLCRSA